VLEKDIRLEGEIVTHMPFFFKALKDFDKLENVKMEKEKKIIKFLEEVLKTLKQNQKTFNDYYEK